MKVKKGKWSKKELDFLEKNYRHMPVSEMSKRLKRSENAIVQRASVLGIKRYKSRIGSKNDTLCWYCKKATGFCDWSHCGTPIDGWEAKRKDIHYKRHDRKIESYIVYKCPEFEKDEV